MAACWIPQFFLDSKQWQLSSEQVFVKIKLVDVEHFFYVEVRMKMFGEVFASTKRVKNANIRNFNSLGVNLQQ